MLVLSRQKDETIVIIVNGELIKVTIVDIRGSKVRIGVDATKNVIVHRQEVYDTVKQAGGFG